MRHTNQRESTRNRVKMPSTMVLERCLDKLSLLFGRNCYIRSAMASNVVQQWNFWVVFANSFLSLFRSFLFINKWFFLQQRLKGYILWLTLSSFFEAKIIYFILHSSKITMAKTGVMRPPSGKLSWMSLGDRLRWMSLGQSIDEGGFPFALETAFPSPLVNRSTSRSMNKQRHFFHFGRNSRPLDDHPLHQEICSQTDEEFCKKRESCCWCAVASDTRLRLCHVSQLMECLIPTESNTYGFHFKHSHTHTHPPTHENIQMIWNFSGSFLKEPAGGGAPRQTNANKRGDKKAKQRQKKERERKWRRWKDKFL